MVVGMLPDGAEGKRIIQEWGFVKLGEAAKE
jgi:hypothetical protein